MGIGFWHLLGTIPVCTYWVLWKNPNLASVGSGKEPLSASLTFPTRYLTHLPTVPGDRREQASGPCCMDAETGSKGFPAMESGARDSSRPCGQVTGTAMGAGG